MKSLPIADQESIQRFIKTLRLHHPGSRVMYKCILGGFQRFAVEQSAGKPLTTQIVRAWLEDRSQHWPLHMIYHRARLVDRFLDWKKAGGLLSRNPLQELRVEYGQRTTTPITWALLSPEPAAALEQLRPKPLFGSFLGPRMREHVTFMRSLGYRYEVYAGMLRHFDCFLQGRPDLVGKPLTVLTQEWQQAGSGVHHAFESQQCRRILAKAWRRADPSVALGPIDPHLARRVRELQRLPYIYTQSEVREILAVARSFPSPLARCDPSPSTRCWCSPIVPGCGYENS